MTLGSGDNTVLELPSNTREQDALKFEKGCYGCDVQVFCARTLTVVRCILRGYPGQQASRVDPSHSLILQ